MAANKKQRRNAGISATMLTDSTCPRRIVLEQDEDYYEHPASYWARLRGTLAHHLMEFYSEGYEDCLQEVRFRKKVKVPVEQPDGSILWVEVEVTGQPDFLDKLRHLLIDFKSNKNVNDSKKPMRKGVAKVEHTEQTNIYKWLLWGGEPWDDERKEWSGRTEYHKVEEIEILYFDMEQFKKIPCPVWTYEDTEAFIIRKLRPIVKARVTGTLPPVWQDVWGDRHILCDYCALRKICDERAERGE